MTVELDLNNRWSRVAAQTAETPQPKSQPKLAPVKKEAALTIAGISPEEARRIAAKFNCAPVKSTDKQGIGATHQGSVISIWIEITPDMATRWLNSNFVNRPVSDDTVTAYARDMANGIWRATHQGIAFNDRDELIDGQHRLLAIKKCGLTIRMMVTFGLPAKIGDQEMTTMDCVDRGRPRSVSDQLKIQHGLKEGGQIASVSAAVGHLCFGERLRKLSVGQTLEIYRAFQPGIDYVIANRSKNAGLKSAGVLAAFAFAFAVPGVNVKERFAMLNTGEDLQSSRILTALREFLISNESLITMRNMHRGIVELVVHCLWLDMTAPENTQLEMKPEEWVKAVVFFRKAQRAHVENIAALFKLPEAA